MALKLRLGAGLALLACGASAVPTAKVAFVRHGLAEGEEDVMYAKENTKVVSLSPQMVSSAIARMMSLDSRPELGTDLPAGDIFNRPDANVMVFVDGVRPQGSKRAPFMTEWLQHSEAQYNVNPDNSWSSLLENILGVSFDVATEVEARGGVVCASVDPALRGSEACRSASWALTLSAVRETVWDNDVSMGPGVEVDASSGLRTLRLKAEAEAHEAGEEVVLNLGVNADLHLAEELAFLSLLPAALAEKFPAREDANPPLVIVYLSSLKGMETKYGEDSVVSRRAFGAMDGALEECFRALANNAGRHLTSQLFVGTALSKEPASRRRRLHDTSESDENTSETMSSDNCSLWGNCTLWSNNTGNYTLEEISQYQLNVWTGAFLILLTFLAVYATVTMDVQPDSLLYAKFITDTSGSGLKTD